MKVATQRTLSGLRRSVFVIFAGVFGVITAACGFLGIGGIFRLFMVSKEEIGSNALMVGFAFGIALLFGLVTNKCLKAAQMKNPQAMPPKYTE